MKIFVLFFSLSCFFPYADAQSINSSVIGSAGDVFITSAIIQEFTVGELIVETYSSAPLVLYQGFHQEVFVGLPLELLLNGVSISQGESECFAALENIFVENFVVKNGAGVILVAGNKIVMGNNVKAEMGSSLVARIDKGGGCDLLLNGVTISQGEPECFAAHENIFVENFVVKYGAGVILVAGNKIVMGKNVKAEMGSSLIARIDNGGGFCDGFKRSSSILSTNEEKELSPTEVLPESGGMIMYPNPASNVLTIELSHVHTQAPVTIDFIGVLGNRELSFTIKEPSMFHTDISVLRSGIYIVRVTTSNEIIVGKIIKQ
jgi:hypothetical protein